MSRKGAEELIKDAEDFLKVAKEEFRVAADKGDTIRMRDSADKAWNAVVQATNALLLWLMGRIPLSHYERRVMLREAEKSKEDLKRLGFRDKYMARFRILHGETFYEGMLDPDELTLEMEKVEEYINDVKKAVTLI